MSLSKEGAEWFWKYGYIIASLPKPQFEKMMLILNMLSANRISVEEAVILVAR